MTSVYIKKHDTFCQIMDGIKCIELRRKSKFISQLLPGQTINFIHNDHIAECVIDYFHTSPLVDLIKKIQLHKLNKNIKTINDAFELYSSYYPNLDINDDFVAIYFIKK